MLSWYRLLPSAQDKAIQALTAALAPRAKVLRDGQIRTIMAVGLVPGDIVIVRLGDIAPADVKLLGTDDEHDQPLQVSPVLRHCAYIVKLAN